MRKVFSLAAIFSGVVLGVSYCAGQNPKKIAAPNEPAPPPSPFAAPAKPLFYVTYDRWTPIRSAPALEEKNYIGDLAAKSCVEVTAATAGDNVVRAIIATKEKKVFGAYIEKKLLAPDSVADRTASDCEADYFVKQSKPSLPDQAYRLTVPSRLTDLTGVTDLSEVTLDKDSCVIKRSGTAERADGKMRVSAIGRRRAFSGLIDQKNLTPAGNYDVSVRCAAAMNIDRTDAFNENASFYAVVKSGAPILDDDSGNGKPVAYAAEGSCVAKSMIKASEAYLKIYATPPDYQTFTGFIAKKDIVDADDRFGLQSCTLRLVR